MKSAGLVTSRLSGKPYGARLIYLIGLDAAFSQRVYPAGTLHTDPRSIWVNYTWNARHSGGKCWLRFRIRNKPKYWVFVHMTVEIPVSAITVNFVV